MGGVGVAVGYAELPLVGRAYLAQLAVRVFGELLAGGACVLRRLLYHLRLDFVQVGVFIGHVVAVVAAGDGHAAFQQLALLADE